jgi:lipid A disaccharide synthetase|tara:strand:- start:211 stop:384 length:174 start_codon:yes stop_codon:yes gene_type:complete
MKKEIITNKENCTDNIYYMQNDDNLIITIDIYAMELEAKNKLKKLYPKYKIKTAYIT